MIAPYCETVKWRGRRDGGDGETEGTRAANGCGDFRIAVFNWLNLAKALSLLSSWPVS